LWVAIKLTDGVLYMRGDLDLLRWAMQRLNLVKDSVKTQTNETAAIHAFNQGALDKALLDHAGISVEATFENQMPMVLFEEILEVPRLETQAFAEALASVLHEGDILIAVHGVKKPLVVDRLFRLAQGRNLKIKSVREELAAVKIPSMTQSYFVDPLVISDVGEKTLEIRTGSVHVKMNREILEAAGIDTVRMLSLLRQIGDHPETFQRMQFQKDGDAWIVGTPFVAFLQTLHDAVQAVAELERAA